MKRFGFGKFLGLVAVAGILMGGSLEARADDSGVSSFAVDDAAWAKSLRMTKNQKGEMERLHRELCRSIEPLVHKRNDLTEKMVREWRAPKANGKKLAKLGRQISDLNRRIEQKKVEFWAKLSGILNQKQREAFLKNHPAPPGGKGRPGKQSKKVQPGQPGQPGQGPQMDPFGINPMAPMQCKAHDQGPKGKKKPGKKPKKPIK